MKDDEDMKVMYSMFQTMVYGLQVLNNSYTTWWAKPQVHDSTEVVKREYRSNKELFNLISFNWWLERDFSWKGLIFNERK